MSAESVSIQGVAPAQVIINEIRANEPGSDTAAEFVELVNVGGTAANIGGATTSLEQLITMMVDADMRRVARE